jgi:hypothetical protein
VQLKDGKKRGKRFQEPVGFCHDANYSARRSAIPRSKLGALSDRSTAILKSVKTTKKEQGEMLALL